MFKNKHNPNYDIFVVPTQDGADADDQWNGSIGDAIMEHVASLKHKSLELENFIHMPNGNIFRIEENFFQKDVGNEKYINKQIVNVLSTPAGHQYKKQRLLTEEDKENVIKFLREEIELNKKAEEEKEDVMEQSLIPYESWELMPQMGSYVDIPATPTPRYIYAGNSNQMFYDLIPEDHPDFKKIDKFIMSINNIDWDDFTEETLKSFTKRILSEEWTHWFAAERLIQFCEELVQEVKKDPDTMMEETLSAIDSDWSLIVKTSTLSKFYKEDIIMSEILEFKNKLEQKKNNGDLLWSDISHFGKHLYSTYKDTIKTAHWIQYKQLKNDFAPSVIVGSIDLNKANANALRAFFKSKIRVKESPI
jgi:hypothetical protein